MSEDITELIALLKDESQRNQAAAKIFDHFLKQLLALIQRNLSGKVRQRGDEEDVLQNVWLSFFNQEFDINSRDELFSLLATIAIRKARDAARWHTAAKRNANQESTPEALDSGRKPVISTPLRVVRGDEFASSPGYEHESFFDEDTARIMVSGASPEQALAAYETLELMPAELRAILVMRMQNLTESEIAKVLGCSRRNVTRKLGIIRTWMLAELDKE